jgi:MOSC domain-containing protein YiiM
MAAMILAVARNPRHHFSKQAEDSITLLEGLGVEGDAHAGVTVRHRSRVARNPAAPNLRQVHLIHAELFTELAAKGFAIAAGDMGENVATQGIDLLALPVGAILRLGDHAEIVVTGLRNPCLQLDRFAAGLMDATLDRDADGGLVRKAGIMATVRRGGIVRPGDAIAVILPPPPHHYLAPV